MTTLTERPAPLPERIQADRTPPRAADEEAFPGRGVLTVIGAVFYGLGWLAGAIVAILVYIGRAIRYGYRQGRRFIPEPPLPEPAPGGSRALCRYAVSRSPRPVPRRQYRDRPCRQSGRQAADP